MTGAADDASLIGRIAGGDATALGALLARHQVRVFRFILRLVRNEAVAEELANEVFLEVWRNAASFEGASSATTWVLSIAHHRAVSSLRKRREESWDEDAAAALPDSGDNPEVLAQKADKSAILRRCVDALSPEHKGIVEEMSVAFRRLHSRRVRVATKYVNLTRRFFAHMGFTGYRIIESPGATEGAPAAGFAELIVDITTTGATLEANGLKVLDDGVILRSEATLIASKAARWAPELVALAGQLCSRLIQSLSERSGHELHSNDLQMTKPAGCHGFFSARCSRPLSSVLAA